MTLHAWCPDGTVRAFKWTGEADSYFSRPARMTVQGRTIRGTVYVASDFETVTLRDGETVHVVTVDTPKSAADIFYPDDPAIRSGVYRFVPRGANAYLIVR